MEGQQRSCLPYECTEQKESFCVLVGVDEWIMVMEKIQRYKTLQTILAYSTTTRSLVRRLLVRIIACIRREMYKM